MEESNEHYGGLSPVSQVLGIATDGRGYVKPDVQLYGGIISIFLSADTWILAPW